MTVSPFDQQVQHIPKVLDRDTYLHLPDNSRLTAPDKSELQPASKAVIFLDRDGVLVEDVHFLRHPSQLRILPGVIQALRALKDHFYLIVVTNQSGIARGLFTETDLLAIHTELVQRLTAKGALVDALYYCPHLPEGAAVKTYQVTCQCRKPRPGMLLQAKRDWDIDLSHSFLVGDMPRDIEAGAAVDVTGILVGNENGVVGYGYAFAPDLAAAASQILMHAA